MFVVKILQPDPGDAPKTGSVIYTKGCAEAGDDWFRQYIIPIAGSVVGVAVIQVNQMLYKFFQL